jgi:hypothetical protein
VSLEDLPMRSFPTAFPRAFLLAATLALTAAPAARALTVENTETSYQALLAKAKAAAPNADWAALRLAYSRRPSFSPSGQSDARKKMLEAAGKSDCAAALAAAKAVVAEAYVDIDAHMVAAFCEDAAGDKAAAQLDRDIGAGLIASIQTGDGLSPASAFTPITVAEEYAVMRAHGVRVTDQALIQQGGHAYDMLTTLNRQDQKVTYYFLIDRVLAAESAALRPGAVSEGGPPDRTP